jgi:hypothetical protein
MLKFLLLFVSILSLSSAKEYCIIAFSSSTFKSADKKLFLNRYPEMGTTEKYKNIFEYKISPHQNYKETKAILKKVRKKYNSAYIINCNSDKSSKSISVTSKKRNTKKQVFVAKHSKKKEIVPLKNHGLLAKKHLSVDASKLAHSSKIPELNEPIILKEIEIPKAYKNDKTQIYDNLTYQRYMDALFAHNDKVDEAFYQEKIDSLLVDIRKDVYNIDIYIEGYLRTGKSVPAQGGGINVNGDYTGAGMAVHADKRLWDGQYNLINNTYDVLNNRLAQIQEINSKEKLAILGTSIYSNLYASQEKLITNKKMYEKQLEVNRNVKNSYKNGKISSIAYLDSKNDLLQMKKTIMSLEQEQQHNDYVLRHSIESKSTKIYKLSAPKIELDMNSLSSIEKQVLNNSSDIAIESNKLQLRKADLLFQKRRYYPEILFNSHLGYGVGNLQTFDLNHAGNGEYWELGLEFKMPIYNRNDIRLNEKREMYKVMKQKSVFSQKQRETLILVDNYYKNVNKILNMKNIVEEQYDLMSQKIVIAREQFLSGIAKYRDYSNASRDYLNYTNQNMAIQEQYLQNLSILSILIGKREFYEKN